MPARLRPASPERYSKEQRRSDTARLYHQLTAGLTKMVAAERGVGSSRVYKMAEGVVANPIETLVADLDRIEREGEGARIAQLVAYLEARYAAPAGSGDGIEGELAAVSRRAGELVARALERLRDGLDLADVPVLSESAVALRRSLDELIREAKKSAAKATAPKRTA